ncbi:MAG TPA: hypothetical protein VIT44_05930 [Cyclobacteriaceae bacterium]
MNTKHTFPPLACILILLFALVFEIKAQQKSKEEFDTRINVLFGLTQPLFAKGFNIEGNFLYKRLAFDYSHGVSLDFSGNTVSGELKEQHLQVHVPYTTGFGVGYRFVPWLSLRVEPKWHRFEIYYEGSQSESNKIVDYNTFSLGLGLYANWRPFRNNPNVLKGIMIAPSIRYWPTVSSTLPGDEFVYDNQITGNTETHHRMEAGINNTPIVFNISVGYSFNLKR